MASINASVSSTGIITSGDASGILQLQSNGTTGLTVNANANVTVDTNLFVSGSRVQPLVSGTAQATTSGTNIDFTNIPSWVKRITVILSGVSTNGSNNLLVRLGTSSGVVTSGYISSLVSVNAATPANTDTTAGFMVASVNSASIVSGTVTICLVGSNVWVYSSTTKSSTTIVTYAAGDITLSGTLDRIRLTMVGGADTFDAGSINILYE